MEKQYNQKIADALINEIFKRCGADSPHNPDSNAATIAAYGFAVAGDLKAAAIEAGKTDLSLEMWECAVNSVPCPIVQKLAA
jgi:hypothetical protein